MYTGKSQLHIISTWEQGRWVKGIWNLSLSLSENPKFFNTSPGLMHLLDSPYIAVFLKAKSISLFKSLILTRSANKQLNKETGKNQKKEKNNKISAHCSVMVNSFLKHAGENTGAVSVDGAGMEESCKL